MKHYLPLLLVTAGLASTLGSNSQLLAQEGPPPEADVVIEAFSIDPPPGIEPEPGQAVVIELPPGAVPPPGNQDNRGAPQGEFDPRAFFQRQSEGNQPSTPQQGNSGNLNRLRQRLAASQNSQQLNSFQSGNPQPSTLSPSSMTPSPTGDIRLNFKDAPVSQVLNYLSEAAGFVIVQEKEVSGTVSITSHQGISQEEAVDLLNAVLVEKGYAAVRNGRILKIVSRSQALTMDLPVRSGANPQEIPKKDELVTQIIPVRYADATKLIENIRPLLEEDVTLSANESSNAIVITDTLTNIRRMAEIIQALDTSISSISAIRVFALEYADATEVADVIKEVFASDTSSSSSRNNFQRMMQQRFNMGGRGGPPGGNSSASSEARNAASRVVAVADEYTNALVVSAPDELLPTIEQIVQQLDTNIADVTEVRVFRLEHADAAELAQLINDLYYDQSNTSSSSRGGMRGGAPAFFGRGGSSNTQRSQRSLMQSRVMAVGDPRTNSLIVSAARETLLTISEMIGRLDASSDKKQKVFVVPLEHADVDNVAEVLRGMFDNGTTGGSRSTSRTGSSTTGTSRLSQRVNTGASTANTTLNNSRGSGGSGGR
ncbi:MAG: putative ral secretion pathway protein [Verrucomicrobiota bacterium]|jgi:type II secretory pathway component GspD/PulD (secretin)